MINYQTITIDLQPDYREPVVQMYLSERDVGRPIQVNVLMQGQPYSFTAGTTVHIDLRKPSGHVVQVNGNYAVGSNVVLFNVVEQMAAEPGMCLTELSIVGDGQDPIGSKNWLTKVELSPMHAGDPSETWIEDLDELVQDAMEGHIDATLSIEGDAADAKATGDAIAAAVEQIPAVDDTLTVSGAAADAAVTGTELADLKSAMSQVELMSSAAFITEDASGAVVAISDGADGVPSKGYTLNIKPHQAGSGDPSPDNVRPISGYTSVDVVRAGKNLLGGRQLADDIVSAVNSPTNTYIGENADGNYVTFQAGSVTADKNFTPNIKFKERTQYTFILRLTRYTVGTNLNANIQVRYTDGTARAAYFNADSEAAVYTIAYTSLSGKTVDHFELAFGDGRTYLFYDESGIFEGVVTTDDFVPYEGQIESIFFPTSAGTVYGGTLVKNADGSGTLSVAYEKQEWDGSSDEEWNDYPLGNGFFRSSISPDPAIQSYGNGWCDIMPTLSSFVGTGIVFGINSRYVFLLQSKTLFGVSTVAELRTYLSEHPINVVYRRNTPQKYTIPASDMAKILTLKGINTVWMSADGTIDLEYCADPKMYISKLITPIQTNIAYLETGTTASRAYTAGQYVIVGDVLYKVASSIASGATFTPGTNIIATTVGGELTALNA